MSKQVAKPRHVVKSTKTKKEQKLYTVVPHVPRSKLGIKNSQVSGILHECIRRVLRKHGPHKRWHPFAKLRIPGWVTPDDSKLSDPSSDADMSLAGSLVSLNTVYKFRLVPNDASPPSLTSAAGIIKGFQSVDPSGAGTWTASEWASLISLFSEIKFDSFEMKFWPVNHSSTALTTATLGNGLAISGVLSTVTVAPTTWNAVIDNADSQIYAFMNDTTDRVFVHRIKGTEISWAIVTTPNPGSYAGCPGSIQYYGNGLVTAQPLLLYSMVGIYSFRSRI